MAEIPIDPQLLNYTDMAFRDAVQTFMRTHAPSTNTAHLCGELQELVDAFVTTSQHLSMQQLLHMLHTQYNLDGLIDGGILAILTANVAAYTQTPTAQYVQNTRPTSDSPYQESSYLQSPIEESDQSTTLAANPTCDESTNLQSVAAENNHDSHSAMSTTYTFIQECTDQDLVHALRTALAASPATNAQNLRFIIITPAEAAALEEEGAASDRQRSLNLARLSSRYNYRPGAGDNSHQAGNALTSNLPALPRHHYPNEPTRCHPPDLARTMELKDKDPNWKYKCDLCGHAIRYYSEFQRHFQYQPGVRDGFRIVHTEARVWYGVDASGAEYMGHLMYHPRGEGRAQLSAIPDPCVSRITPVRKALRLATVAKKKAAAAE